MSVASSIKYLLHVTQPHAFAKVISFHSKQPNLIVSLKYM